MSERLSSRRAMLLGLVGLVLVVVALVLNRPSRDEGTLPPPVSPQATSASNGPAAAECCHRAAARRTARCRKTR
ncbi:hypothetical protein [Elstera litoralis]|uniref:hypothetical protein n=1 Tax=Elstera litoralis TaxID=552518 RepID=UPI0012ECD792|nr:hypothetical protein [Elstera litoralis]